MVLIAVRRARRAGIERRRDMKAFAFGVVALSLAAGMASAAQPWVMGFEPLSAGDLPQTRASNSVVFSAIPSPYAAFAAATGNIGFDDYDSTLAGGSAFLQSMKFVGGFSTLPVGSTTGAMRVEFYDTTAAFINSFTVNLPTGNSIWNIGLETVANAKDSTFLIPEAGFIQLVATGGALGQFFLSTAVPTIGTESRTLGDTATHSHRFELTVPAPGSMALLGLGGLLAARRRR
jgi:hypothetical protein